MSLQPLPIHACDLGAKWFPVTFRDGRADHFVDDIGEVLQDGDGRSGSGIEHRETLAGRTQRDGARQLLQLSAATMKLDCDFLVGLQVGPDQTIERGQFGAERSAPHKCTNRCYIWCVEEI